MQTNANVVTTNNVFLTKSNSFMTKKYVSVFGEVFLVVLAFAIFIFSCQI